MRVEDLEDRLWQLVFDGETVGFFPTEEAALARVARLAEGYHEEGRPQPRYVITPSPAWNKRARP